MNKILQKDLAKKLNTSVASLRTYLDRAEFRGITKEKVNRHVYYTNIDKQHMNKLMTLLHRPANRQNIGRTRDER